MKPSCRWPLHPSPAEGESLSSWLSRTAHCYGLSVQDLLVHDLGWPADTDLDVSPPPSLQAMIAERSGVGLDRVRIMSLTGWQPWLLDRVNPLAPDPAAFAVYARQFAILLPARRRPPCSPPLWQAWMPLTGGLPRACPCCLQDSGEPPLMLVWQLPLMLSCPRHGCLLKTYPNHPPHKPPWEEPDYDTPELADDGVKSMDARTWQALTAGSVNLPRRRVNGGLWFRLLRTLLDEVNTPIAFWPSRARVLRSIWEMSGLPLRAGQTIWRPFEYMSAPIQLQMLKAVAVTIHLIEHGEISAPEAEAALFRPEPHFSEQDGRPLEDVQPSAYWQQVMIAVDQVITEARTDPKAAQELWWAMTMFSQSEVSLERARSILGELSIPADFLSL